MSQEQNQQEQTPPEVKTYQTAELIDDLLGRVQGATIEFLQKFGLLYHRVTPVVEACHLVAAVKAAIISGATREDFLMRAGAHYDESYAEAEKLGVLADLEKAKLADGSELESENLPEL